MTFYPQMVSCRMTEADFGMLTSNAESAGMDRSKYLRTLIRIPAASAGAGSPVYVVDNRTLAMMSSELVRWGRHYNQAVRALNTLALFARRGSTPDRETTMRLLESAERKLSEVEDGRQMIEYVLIDIADAVIVGGD